MKISIVLAAALLAGCSTGHYEVDSKAMDKTKLAFVGIPTVLGIGYSGTTTPVTATTSLTNKHVAYPTFKKVLKTHKTCDIALIAQNNKGESVPVKIGYPKQGETIRMYGYSARTTLPVSSVGKVIGFAYDDHCLVGITDAGSVQGMSGGGVFNEKGELVGIFYKLALDVARSYFIVSNEFNSILPLEVRK